MEVVVGDAGGGDAYLGALPADLVMLCGVFGNISDDDIRRRVAPVPSWCVPGGTVLWTRGAVDGDLASQISRWFTAVGCRETAYLADERLEYRVVEHRYDGPGQPLEPGQRFFTFI